MGLLFVLSCYDGYRHSISVGDLFTQFSHAYVGGCASGPAESVSVHRHVLGGEPGNVVGAVTFAFLSRGHDPTYFQVIDLQKTGRCLDMVIELQKKVDVSTWSLSFKNRSMSRHGH